MKSNTIIFLFLIIGALSSCTLENDNDDDMSQRNEESFIYQYHLNSQIKEEINDSGHSNATIVSGDKIVFEYQFVFGDLVYIADDEFTESILFEVDPDLNEFRIETEELNNSNAIYGLFCYCMYYGYYDISSGVIEGVKLEDGNWEVSMDVTIVFEGDVSSNAEVDHIFVLKE